MLDSLIVQNYRNLKEVRIHSLGQINLITGKNNTGKTTLLEAIAIYASKADISILEELLIRRGENLIESPKSYGSNYQKIFSSLFTNTITEFNAETNISIGTIENGELSIPNAVSIKFVRFSDKLEDSPNGGWKLHRNIIENNNFQKFDTIKSGLETRAGNHSFVIPFDGTMLYTGFTGMTKNVQFIRSWYQNKEENSKQWDNIIFTEKETVVIDALKIIEPNTERLAFIENGSGQRNAVIKLSNSTNVLPIQSMGDGMNRILSIILALVNSENGFLLIDEFENGLHHTVQKNLWNLIFQTATKLNVQVFATTHSDECIRSYENILNHPESQFSGNLIRLENKNGMIHSVEFSKEELTIVTENQMEVR